MISMNLWHTSTELRLVAELAAEKVVAKMLRAEENRGLKSGLDTSG